MTTYAMANSQWREVRTQVLSGLAWVLYALGFVLVRTLRAVGTAVAAVLFALGWTARKVGPWCVAAFREGWDAGKPKVRNGPA